MTHAFVHDHLRPLHRYVIKPVIDLARQAPVDAYEVPDRLREAVWCCAAGDVFPFAGLTSRGLDADHTVAYDPSPSPPGHRSCLVDRGSGTSGRWAASTTGSRPTGTGCCASRSPGSTCGATRTAVVYLEDHTGTHEVTPPGNTLVPPAATTPSSPCTPPLISSSRSTSRPEATRAGLEPLTGIASR